MLMEVKFGWSDSDAVLLRRNGEGVTERHCFSSAPFQGDLAARIMRRVNDNIYTSPVPAILAIEDRGQQMPTWLAIQHY